MSDARVSAPARAATALALAAAALAGSPAAWAQGSPWSIGASQRFTHQSNVLQSGVDPVSDTISQTSLTASLNQPISRQRVFGSLTASANRYQDRKALNYDGYNARLGLDWSTVARLSGSLVADASQGQADYSAVGFDPVLPSTRNTTRSRGLAATVRLGGVGRLALEGSATTRATRYSNPAYASRNLDVDEASLGVRYRVGGALTVGAGLRTTQGDYVSAGEGYEGRNLDVFADWGVSGASRLRLRLSSGNTDYDNLRQRDFSGVTGSLGWSWQPTGKVSLGLNVSRTAGDETVPRLGAEDVLLVTSANRVTDTLGLTANYQMTAKVAVTANVSRSSAESVPAAGTGTVNSRSTSALLGARWDATRAITVGCEVGRITRSAATNVPGYDNDTVGCYGQVTLR